MLVVADAAGQIDSFEFGDVIMYGCPSEIDSDSRQKVTVHTTRPRLTPTGSADDTFRSNSAEDKTS